MAGQITPTIWAQTLYQDSQTGTMRLRQAGCVLAAEVDIWLNQANAALAAGPGGTVPGFQYCMAIIACLQTIPEWTWTR